MTKFAKRVYQVVKSIPPGKVMTYGEVARKAGSPRAARAVGTILSKNYNPSIPCHRVIKANGNLGQYNRGVEIKKKLLRKEGYEPTRV
jgi:methylated-DNA-[protein]-cysteine S-methyltransferase